MVKALQMMWKKVGEEGGFSDAVNLRSQELKIGLRRLEEQEKQLAKVCQNLADETGNVDELLPANVVRIKRRK